MSETVTLLHGSAGSGALWAPIRESLERHGFATIAPDLIGYEQREASTIRNEGRLDDDVERLEKLIRNSDSPLHLVGYSYGGAVAMAYALSHPGSLASLTVIEPVVFYVLRYLKDYPAYNEVSGVRDQFDASLRHGHVESALEGFVDYWSGAGTWGRMPSDMRNAFVAWAPQIRANWEASFGADPGMSSLEQLKLNTLIVSGTLSPFASRRICAGLNKLIEKSSLRFVEGANHLLPLTHRAELSELLLSHITEPRQADH